MVIREATYVDLQDILKLVDSLQVSRDQPDWKEKTSGLFEYPKSFDELNEALNPYFLIAKSGNGPLGFSISYDSNFFNKKFKNSPFLEWKRIEEERGDFLYMDQLGVAKPDSLGAGRIALNLFNHSFEKAKSNNLEYALAYVCLEPLLNQRSKNILERLDFKEIEKMEIENKILLGLYKKDFK
ncbi:MAG: hypothetical protein WC867_05385 [Candidatus Pacearchaeota archaeon]|jgi:hypothetical protein